VLAASRDLGPILHGARHWRAGAGLRWRIKESDCFCLDYGVSIIVAARVPNDNSIGAQLCAGFFELRDCVTHGRVSPARLVSSRRDYAQHLIRPLRVAVVDLHALSLDRTNRRAGRHVAVDLRAAASGR
jgi:hypothetical protein